MQTAMHIFFLRLFLAVLRRIPTYETIGLCIRADLSRYVTFCIVCVCVSAADGAPGKTHRSPFQLPSEYSFVAGATVAQDQRKLMQKMKELLARPPKKALKASGLGYALRYVTNHLRRHTLTNRARVLWPCQIALTAPRRFAVSNS